MMGQYGFRVFLSYAHLDKPLVEKIALILREQQLYPLWDIDIHPGKTFTDEIKELIKRSHLFIPVITENSQYRPWVHQETGYAIALNIPILPITIGGIPSEMISSIQAISVQEDLADLPEKLREINLEQLILPPPQKPASVVEIADWPETRAELMHRYASWIIDLGEYGLVRTQSRLPVFSIPDRDVDDPIWEAREGDSPRSKYLRHVLRQERTIFERHARIAGCRMIVDPTTASFNTSGQVARKTRLQIMLDFLKSMPEDKVEIVISSKAQETNLVMIGDYFYAESMVPRVGVGYLQTIFHSHPPTVLQKVKRFDQLFAELKTQHDTSLGYAVAQFEAEIEKT